MWSLVNSMHFRLGRCRVRTQCSGAASPSRSRCIGRALRDPSRGKVSGGGLDHPVRRSRRLPMPRRRPNTSPSTGHFLHRRARCRLAVRDTARGGRQQRPRHRRFDAVSSRYPCGARRPSPPPLWTGRRSAQALASRSVVKQGEVPSVTRRCHTKDCIPHTIVCIPPSDYRLWATVRGTSCGSLPACLERSQHGRRGCGLPDPFGSCPLRLGNRRPV